MIGSDQGASSREAGDGLILDKVIEMKKFAILFAAAVCFPVLALTGCGGTTETTVIEAPAVDEPDAVADMENYDAEMEKSMSEQGN
jgi:hypothetical protein